MRKQSLCPVAAFEMLVEITSYATDMRSGRSRSRDGRLVCSVSWWENGYCQAVD